jgi:hypothetical protein
LKRIASASTREYFPAIKGHAPPPAGSRDGGKDRGHVRFDRGKPGAAGLISRSA